MAISEQEELAALRTAVGMMGFDSDKLVDFARQEGNDQCRGMLLSCVNLDVEALRKRGAGNIDAWQQIFAALRSSS